MYVSHQKASVIFNNLTVTTIEDSSGIFIGTNQAIGWSSYNKTNQGLGRLSGASLSNAINVVYDSDVIDAPVEDVRYITLSDALNNNQQCSVDFRSVNVNTVQTGSAIDLGDNKQLGWKSTRKVNYGSSKNLGTNQLRQFVSILHDNDLVDSPVQGHGRIVDNAATQEPNIRISQKADSE